MTKIISFNDALKATEHQNNRHILLGNGFSRACRNDIFAYSSLFENADFAALSEPARSVFDALETTDFEAVIEALGSAAKVLSVYAEDKKGILRSSKKRCRWSQGSDGQGNFWQSSGPLIRNK